MQWEGCQGWLTRNPIAMRSDAEPSAYAHDSDQRHPNQDQSCHRLFVYDLLIWEFRTPPLTGSPARGPCRR